MIHVQIMLQDIIDTSTPVPSDFSTCLRSCAATHISTRTHAPPLRVNSSPDLVWKVQHGAQACVVTKFLTPPLTTWIAHCRPLLVSPDSVLTSVSTSSQLQVTLYGGCHHVQTIMPGHLPGLALNPSEWVCTYHCTTTSLGTPNFKRNPRLPNTTGVS